MRRVIGMDIQRTFGKVVIWEDGKLRHAGQVDITRTALEGFGKSLGATDEVVIEATGNCMAVSRVLSPFVARVVIANPLQVKAIAHAHLKTDKVDAGTLASLCAAGYLPEIWTPDAVTERKRRLVARRYQIVRHRTRIKNEVHAILHAYLIPPCPHADLFSKVGRAWLERQPVPDDERVAIERHVRELDRMEKTLLPSTRRSPLRRSTTPRLRGSSPFALRYEFAFIRLALVGLAFVGLVFAGFVLEIELIHVLRRQGAVEIVHGRLLRWG